MKRFALLACLALAACGDPPPACMSGNESGIVTGVRGDVDRYCGRGGCYDTPSTTVSVRMADGTTRVCNASRTTPDMLVVGQRMRLTMASRVL